MWLLFALAAVLVFLGGIGGSLIVKTSPEMVPKEVFAYLPLAENIVYSLGIGLSLLGVALCYRKIGSLGRGRGSRRSRRTRPIERPRQDRVKEEPAEVVTEPEEYVAIVEEDSESATRKLPGVD